MTFYRPKFFNVYELVDKATYEKFGDKALMFFNPNLLVSLDGVRLFFDKPVTVNNWHDGGPFQSRGLRPKSCDVGAEYGQHRFGNAADLDVQGMNAEEVRQAILSNKDDQRLCLITAMESGVSWVHLDCRNIASRITLFPAG